MAQTQTPTETFHLGVGQQTRWDPRTGAAGLKDCLILDMDLYVVLFNLGHALLPVIALSRVDDQLRNRCAVRMLVMG
jgi:hypothetical protein